MLLCSREISTILWVDAGSPVFTEGEPGNCAYLVEEGSVAIVVEQGGRRVQVASRHQGDIIGEMAIIDGRPRSASVVALEPCKLTVVTASQLQNRLAQLDPVLRLCMNTILDRFRASMADVRGNDRDAAAAARLSPKDSVKAIDALRLESELAHAIRENELELHLQPIVRLGDGDVAGFESLIRWRHPERGLISPGAFVPIAEASGLIVEMTRWVVAEVSRLARQFEIYRHPIRSDRDPLFFTINLSGQDLVEPGFVDGLEREVVRNEQDAANFKLEITESVLMQDPSHAATVLGQCRELGFAVAIDDFGTGYSSFDYLHRFPIDCLKIDRAFVGDLPDDHRARAIVGSIINLSDSLGIPVVAEGIENPEQIEILDALGCVFAQGYYFAKPLQVAQVPEYMKRVRKDRARRRHLQPRHRLCEPALIARTA